MVYVQKLPFILGAIAAIITGMIGTYSGLDQQDNYIRMAISMVVLFTIGVYIKKVITGINQEIESKKIEEERIQEELNLQNEETANQEKENGNLPENKPTIDYKIDDGYGEDFTPLTISDYLKKE